MNRITFYNSIVIAVALVLTTYSVVISIGGNWSKANYFLVLAAIMFSFIHYGQRR